MKRVTIKTPGKIITYKGFQVRTPTYIDVEDSDLLGLKMYLKLNALEDYEVKNVDEKDSESPSKRTKKGLRTAKYGVKGGVKLNFKL